MAHPTHLIPTGTPGTLRIMACPPDDELASTCAELRRAQVTDVLSLLPETEAMELGLTAEADYCAAVGMAFTSYPIPDFGLPEPEAFLRLVTWLADVLQAGRHVTVHCRAGIGRSGMVAASVLIALGSDADRAVAAVSAARGVSIPDTVEQGEFIASFAHRLYGEFQSNI